MLKGVALSIASSSIFAGLYYYTTLLDPLDGEAIFGWRMLLMFPCFTIFLMVKKEWKSVSALCMRVRKSPNLILLLCISSALSGVQQWLFMWAPLNGHGLDVSLGYFLLPLMLLLVGRLTYGERLTRLQKTAAALAVIGVANELYRVGGISWPTVLVAVGFPVYFVLRRTIGTAHTGGLWFDIVLTSPVAAYCALGQGVGIQAFATVPRLYLLLPLMAVISAAGFISHTLASRLLPFSLFGLLGYVEPILLVVVSLVLGERIRTEAWMTYIPIWAAVVMLVLDGVRYLWRASRREGRSEKAARL